MELRRYQWEEGKGTVDGYALWASLPGDLAFSSVPPSPVP